MRRILLAATNAGARVFRNHVAMGWQGDALTIRRNATLAVRPGDVLIRNARPMKAGLCAGSADIVGWHTVKITPEMVGRQVAVFLAIEVKAERGRLTDEQRNFLAQVEQAGGIAMEARSVERVKEGLS